MPWTPEENDAVVKAIAITCEVTSTTLSEGAKRFMLRELEAHPAAEVLTALRKCAHTCKGRLALADVLIAITEVDRKQLSDERAARSAYLTTLRGCALVERIAWCERDPERVRLALEAKGYRFDYAPREPVKALPEWTEP